jgi:hypothetical protein
MTLLAVQKASKLRYLKLLCCSGQEASWVKQAKRFIQTYDKRAATMILATLTTTVTAAFPISMTVSTDFAAIVLAIMFNSFTNVNHAQAGLAGAFH